MTLRSIEFCAGAGGQALGLERAGFEHEALVEVDHHACATLTHNRPKWRVISRDLSLLDSRLLGDVEGIDLIAAGVPCPPFSMAGKQEGENDARDMFPHVLRFIEALRPRAVMIENVRGLLASKFEYYRRAVTQKLESFGYAWDWQLLHASDFGVPQLRPRSILVAIQKDLWPAFTWPDPIDGDPVTVGDALLDEMASAGWGGAKKWAKGAQKIAPTLVGGSKKHGGPDLGPTRAKRAWAELGVDGKGLHDAPPPRGYKGMPRLTVSMAARIQGFPSDWEFVGRKTNAYRQVGNAFPPPVAEAVGRAIAAALNAGVVVPGASDDAAA